MEIFSVLGSLKWKPLNLTFSHAICNPGGDGLTDAYSLIVLADDQTQQELHQFVDLIEKTLEENGVNFD